MLKQSFVLDPSFAYAFLAFRASSVVHGRDPRVIATGVGHSGGSQSPCFTGFLQNPRSGAGVFFCFQFFPIFYYFCVFLRVIPERGERVNISLFTRVPLEEVPSC